MAELTKVQSNGIIGNAQAAWSGVQGFFQKGDFNQDCNHETLWEEVKEKKQSSFLGKIEQGISDEGNIFGNCANQLLGLLGFNIGDLNPSVSGVESRVIDTVARLCTEKNRGKISAKPFQAELSKMGFSEEQITGLENKTQQIVKEKGEAVSEQTINGAIIDKLKGEIEKQDSPIPHKVLLIENRNQFWGGVCSALINGTALLPLIQQFLNLFFDAERRSWHAAGLITLGASSIFSNKMMKSLGPLAPLIGLVIGPLLQPLRMIIANFLGFLDSKPKYSQAQKIAELRKMQALQAQLMQQQPVNQISPFQNPHQQAYQVYNDPYSSLQGQQQQQQQYEQNQMAFAV